ncbi:hypothetical protein F5Y18DRAFT_362618 [Xylariaceae sp. FL1019]|nr:hypothetical protein F5Y18DRAFT_362618 [Xylariaceae sp. FL1019]
MHSSKILSLALVAASSAEITTPTPTKMARATKSSADDSCDSSILSVYSGLPTPPPAISGALTGQQFYNTDLSQICAYQSKAPSSAQSVYTSYNNAVYSYLEDHSSAIVSVASKCDDDGTSKQFDEILAAYSTFSGSGCSTTAGSPTTTSTTTGSPTTTSTTAGSPTTTSTPGAAPKETGRAVAAVAAAVVGVAAFL